MRSSLLLGIILLAALHASPVSAAELFLTPPKMDYAKICKQEVLEVPNGTPDDKLDDKRLLKRGMFFLRGNAKIPADEEHAFAIFTRLAKSDSPQAYKAKFQLAKATLRREKTTSQERKHAIALLEDAMKRGVPDSFYYLGAAYEKEGDYNRAAEYYRRSATEGNTAAAALALVYLYADGHGLPATETDAKAAAEKMMNWAQSLLLQALGKGDCSALPAVADIYYATQANLQNREIAAPWLQAGADAGYTVPMIRLAYLYSHGIGVKLNPERAVVLWEKAAEAGHPAGMYLLGLAYINGEGTTKNPEGAIRWFSESVRHGYSASAEVLADIYQGMHGGKADPEKAFSWLEQGSRAKDASPKLFFRLAKMYEYGKGTAQDYTKAFEFYRKAAESGSALAMVKVGDFYRNGLGIQADPMKSYRFYRMAATQQNNASMLALAENYTCGIGKPANQEWAQRWQEKAMNGGATKALADAMKTALARDKLDAVEDTLHRMKRAARAGNREIMVYLGKAYGEGKVVKRDEKAAQEWFARAVSPGKDDAEGLVALGRYYVESDSGKRATEGKELLQKAIALGSDEARYRLAKLDAARAPELLAQAAENGHAPSMMALAQLFKSTDPAAAEKWLIKAADHHKIGAMFKLAEGYHKGTWGTADETKAAFWMERAIGHHPCDPEDRTELAMAYANGIGVKKDAVKALAMLEESVQGGDGTAMLTLAHLHLYGIGMKPDTAKALSWLNKAAEAGNNNAMLELGNSYAVGLGVQQDSAQAKHWWQEAAGHGNTQAALLLETKKN